MSKIWMPAVGSGSTVSDDCTAGKDKVLSGYTAITKDSGDEPAAGTMTNQGAVSQALNAGGSYTIPAGYHNGSGKVTANSLSSQTGGATAGDGDVLSSKSYWKDGAKRTGTMANQGAKTSALNAGGSYTIPAGYHNGSGKVTANSLSSQTGATATAAQILSGQTAWVNGSKLTGSMANQGTKTSALNCGGSYTIPAGYHSGSGKVTANSLASQTSATAAAGNLISGKTAWVNGSKITGTLSIQSAISFSAAALSYDTIRISWKNPAKGPWQGVFIQMSTSGNPGTGGGSRVYTGAGTNPNQAGGNNYVDIGGLSPGTTYYFTCTSYCDALGWGASNNVSARTNVYILYSYGDNIVGFKGTSGVKFETGRIQLNWGGPSDSRYIEAEGLSIPIGFSTAVVTANINIAENVSYDSATISVSADEKGYTGSYKARGSANVTPRSTIKYTMPLSQKLNALGCIFVTTNYVKGSYGYSPATHIYEIALY